MRRRTRAGRKGAAIVEFAVLIPFLLYLCIVAADWARLMYFSQCVNDCARAGALWASDAEVRQKSRYTTVTDAALAESPGISPTPTVAETDTTDSQGKLQWVTVTVTIQFNTISNFPGVPASQTLSRSIRAKVAPLESR
ncbi:MAG TPA: TadE/TadG family type IV pilus assembly protein [Fimbriiglobus sp.]|nr:TadE/TadG family type IV pilus assembly protein [Fimbriiglobus sp.]